MGEYAQLGPVHTWYEQAGEGDPVVLLHGGMSDGSGWALQTPVFAKHHSVFVPDRRAHGRTADLDGPLTYGAMADETIAFVETVVGGPAHLVGWSDGGIVALLVARARPDLVRRQVVIGANFHHSGLMGDSADLGDDPDAPGIAVFKDMYEAVSVDGPEHWPVFHAKTARLWREEPTMTTDDLAGIATPTLVLVGDDEPIWFAHTIELFEALPAGQLAVVPGTSHLLLLEKPDVVNRVILDFLAETGEPETIWPIRRASR